jgi:hypothetical protein
MKKLSFYEQVGIVIPGSALLFGLIFFFPRLHEFFTKDGFGVGGLGVFVLVSYAAGHLIAALGNLIESVMWALHGGMPSDWVNSPAPNILSAAQVALLETRLRSRLGLRFGDKLEGLDQNELKPITRQVYADVMKHGKTARIDRFNGNYGLNRGLCASAAILAAVAGFQGEWLTCTVIAGISAIYLYRARRFGIHYARELYVQFLAIPSPLTVGQRRVSKKKR